MSDSREVLDPRSDPYASYGAKVGATGQYLSFDSGEFQYGQNKAELKLGSRLVANMPGLRVGWRRWYGGQVTDDLTELLAECRPMQRRNDLGDEDVALWEKPKATPNNPTPAPRDPWQITNILELMGEDGETYIFSTGSKGGIGAIGRLCTAYGKERRMRPGMLPIIELGRDSYMHKEYGKTYFPVFTIVGWTDEDAPSVGEGTESEEEIPFDPPGKAANGAKKTRF